MTRTWAEERKRALAAEATEFSSNYQTQHQDNVVASARLLARLEEHHSFLEDHRHANDQS